MSGASPMVEVPSLPNEAADATSKALAHLGEMLVYVATDPAGVATALLDEFGTVGAVLDGSDARIRRAIGCQPAIIRTLRSIAAGMQHVLLTRVQERPVLGSHCQVRDYLCTRHGFRRTEVVHALHLDTRNRLIRDEEVSRGTIDKAHIHVREVIGRALELGSAGLIIIHNHPSGDPSPTKADIDITRALERAARLFGIGLHDHIIVGGQDLISMRARCLF